MDHNPPTSFGMFSEEGDAAVRAAVLGAIDDLRNGVDRETALVTLRGRTASIEEAHDEIGDTDVREQIAAALEGPLLSRGFTPIESGDEILE